MASTDELAELERQWRSEGTDEETIGARLRAMVDEEAARNEAEDPDEEAEATDEEEAEGRTDPLMEARMAFMAAVFEAGVDPAEIQPCLGCGGWGYVPAGLSADPHAHQCEECRGFGAVVTGSQVEGNITRVCTNCNGAGFVSESPQIVAPPPVVIPPFVAPVVPVEAIPFAPTG